MNFAVGRFAGYYAIYGPGARLLQFDPRTLDQTREFISDTLLHEMIHHFLAEESRGDELVGDPDQDHGRRFCREANRIGQMIGLQRVAAGREAAIEWPQSVRPPGYAEWR